jgi:hypothetical protein
MKICSKHVNGIMTVSNIISIAGDLLPSINIVRTGVIIMAKNTIVNDCLTLIWMIKLSIVTTTTKKYHF